MTVTLSSKLQITKLSDEVVGDGYPFEAVILSGEPIDRWYGRFVVELSTMQYHKPRLSVNYNHNPELIIGYGEDFQVSPEGLKSTGKLVAGTFADEVVKLAKQGVPFEASVEIDIENAIETRVGADSQAVCNGRTYSGPISIYSNVPLLAYAICQCGADKHTTLTLLKKEIDFTMKKPPKKTIANLSKEDNPNAAPSTDMTPAVKSQELADLCSIFGDKNGIALYQSGTDVGEVRTWQSLNEKYAKYLSADEEEEPPKDDEEDLANDDDEPSPPEPDPTPEPDDEKDKLSAVLAKLVKQIDAQSAEMTKLKAAIPRGAEPVSHGTETLQAEPKKNSVAAATERYKKKGVKEPKAS
ncbi:MAG: hypothetical protein FWE95_06195 [Planctomycetaceae bacterium]|nr:hypothetical protein [Planctomycetaceae bacterium]